MVKVQELKDEIKSVEKQYEEAKTDRAKYMLQRRLIHLKRDLNEYYRLQKQVAKYE